MGLAEAESSDGKIARGSTGIGPRGLDNRRNVPVPRGGASGPSPSQKPSGEITSGLKTAPICWPAVGSRSLRTAKGSKSDTPSTVRERSCRFPGEAQSEWRRSSFPTENTVFVLPSPTWKSSKRNAAITAERDGYLSFGPSSFRCRLCRYNLIGTSPNFRWSRRTPSR